MGTYLLKAIKVKLVLCDAVIIVTDVVAHLVGWDAVAK